MSEESGEETQAAVDPQDVRDLVDLYDGAMKKAFKVGAGVKSPYFFEELKKANIEAVATAEAAARKRTFDDTVSQVMEQYHAEMERVGRGASFDQKRMIRSKYARMLRGLGVHGEGLL